jgi:5-methylcytosine-specific restriction endonuclease McrBC GTP-binding regulatory subunit McrB
MTDTVLSSGWVTAWEQFMRENEFREWMMGSVTSKGKPPAKGTMDIRIGNANKLEAALLGLGFQQATLESMFKEGRWPDLLARLKKLKTNPDADKEAMKSLGLNSENSRDRHSKIARSAKLYGYFLEGRDPKDSAVVETEEEEMEEELGDNLLPTNLILYGPPGTGKTYRTASEAVQLCDGSAPDDRKVLMDRYTQLVEEKRIGFVTFHQNYGYEDFVEGLRPTNKDENGDLLSAGFRLAAKDGIFRTMCKRAESLWEAAESQEDATLRPHVLIIDEINRGNMSKIFGELITLIEADKRKGQPNALSVILPYSGESFSVPDNLHIIGTMNTADRSIALLDTALRRRFTFREMEPVPSLLSKVGNIDLERLLTTINERIEYLHDREHRIGHAFFFNCKTKADIDGVMRDKVIPLLQEYFFEDWGRVAAILGGGFIEGMTLQVPPELPENFRRAGDAKRWSVRKEFAIDAYTRLIAGKGNGGGQAGVADDSDGATDEDGDGAE